jgi:glycosyltransferase involved in cell wall biosynthesis
MWPITPIELYGMSPRHPFVRIVQHAENYFCRNAERVVSILPCAKDYFMEHGMEEKRFVYIPNGISLSDWESPEMLPDDYLGIINKAKNEKRFILSFFGSHTRSYSLDYLIKALARTDQSRIFVAFVGEGNYKEELIKLAKELGIHPDAYAFLPAINKKAIPSLIRISDASYVGAINNRMFRFGIGMNKLFDAMMGGKPILYAVDAPNNIVEEYQCGISVPAENTDELANGLVKLIQMPEDEKKQMGENGHNAIMNRFIYPIIAKQFSEIFN